MKDFIIAVIAFVLVLACFLLAAVAGGAEWGTADMARSVTSGVPTALFCGLMAACIFGD